MLLSSVLYYHTNIKHKKSIHLITKMYYDAKYRVLGGTK